MYVSSCVVFVTYCYPGCLLALLRRASTRDLCARVSLAIGILWSRRHRRRQRRFRRVSRRRFRRVSRHALRPRAPRATRTATQRRSSAFCTYLSFSSSARCPASRRTRRHHRLEGDSTHRRLFERSASQNSRQRSI